MDKLQAPPAWSRGDRDAPDTGRRQGAMPNNPEVEDESGVSDTAIGYLVRDVHRSLARALQSKIASHGVSMGQWFFLRALWDADGLTQRELSQRVGMMEPTTVTALNGMERRGLVERVRNAHDRRKVNIYLTPKGRALRDVLMPCSIDANKEATRGIGHNELMAAMDVLRRMVNNLSGDTLLDEAEDVVDPETGLH